MKGIQLIEYYLKNLNIIQVLLFLKLKVNKRLRFARSQKQNQIHQCDVRSPT